MVSKSKLNTKKIFLAGHLGMVGSAIEEQLKKLPGNKVITASREHLDLLNQKAVQSFLNTHKPDQIYLAAAKVGGIYANNTYPAEFIYQNLMIQTNVIHSAHLNGVPKLLFLGSSCIYPKASPQPMNESSLLTGILEETNEPYAVAKIAGIKLCESYNRQYGHDYRSVMPTNLYGPNDNFNLENSHVIPALIKKIHEAKYNDEKTVSVWGTGIPKREFLHVDDMAKAAIFIMNLDLSIYQSKTRSMLSHVNIGSGVDCTIKQLVETISDVIGYQGGIIWDTSKPDGTPRKLMDISRIESMGWRPTIELREGLRMTYSWYLENLEKIKS
jgi:GDP-L-fucose synthase